MEHKVGLQQLMNSNKWRYYSTLYNSNRWNNYLLWRLQNSYFTGPGTFTVCSVGNPAGSNTVDYLVVAGGGGGGGLLEVVEVEQEDLENLTKFYVL
jgi:hypothetical protein